MRFPIPHGFEASRDLFRDVRRGLRRADPGLMAAAVAFNTFFAIVPLAVASLTAASFIGSDDDALARTEETLDGFVPEDVADFITDLLVDAAEVAGGQRGSIFAISALVALYSGSRGVIALQKALAQIEGDADPRPGWQLRLVGTGLTITAGFTLPAAGVSLLLGSRAVDFLVELTGIRFLDELWAWMRFPLAVATLFLFLWAVYHFGPPRPLPGAWLAALTGAGAAIVTSLAFGWYLNRFGLASTFGVLGAVAVGLLWLYLTIYAFLFAAALVVSIWLTRERHGLSLPGRVGGSGTTGPGDRLDP